MKFQHASLKLLLPFLLKNKLTKTDQYGLLSDQNPIIVFCGYRFQKRFEPVYHEFVNLKEFVVAGNIKIKLFRHDKK